MAPAGAEREPYRWNASSKLDDKQCSSWRFGLVVGRATQQPSAEVSNFASGDQLVKASRDIRGRPIPIVGMRTEANGHFITRQRRPFFSSVGILAPVSS